MTLEEANRMLALAKVSYSHAFKNMSEDEKILLVHSWAFSLQDIPADIVMLAFFELLSKSKWLPTIAEIRAQIVHLHSEAEEFLHQVRLMELQSPSVEDLQHVKKLHAIANNIYRRTDRFVRGLHGTESGLTLSSILSAADANDRLDNNMILNLLIPPGNTVE